MDSTTLTTSGGKLRWAYIEQNPSAHPKRPKSIVSLLVTPCVEKIPYSSIDLNADYVFLKGDV